MAVGLCRILPAEEDVHVYLKLPYHMVGSHRMGDSSHTRIADLTKNSEFPSANIWNGYGLSIFVEKTAV